MLSFIARSMQLQRHLWCIHAAQILQMIRPHNHSPKFERKYQNLGDERPGDQGVGKRNTRQFSVAASEKELQLRLAKLKRSQGLSVTVHKLESDSGSGNNLQLVINSLKSLELPKM